MEKNNLWTVPTVLELSTSDIANGNAGAELDAGFVAGS
jgi:hypothetical protein